MNEGFDGMAELIADLQAMPAEVQAEAEGIVATNADLFAADLPSRYPAQEGNLRDGVRHEVLSPLRHRVRNVSPHAHLFEFGSVQRHLASNGANRGSMPAKPTFIPRAIEVRKRMVERLVDLVKGQKVRGMAGSLEVRER